MKIGVVGYSTDHIAAKRILTQSLKHLIALNQSNEPIEIVSGLTNIGIPMIAYQIADELGYIKIGISAERALHVKCGIYDVDTQIIEGKEFGDESVFFVSYIDCLVRVGGGKQSEREVQMFIEKCVQNGINISECLIENDFSLS